MRAMPLKTSLLFTATFLLIYGALEWTARKLYPSDQDLLHQQRAFLEAKRQVRVFILGSSHAWMGVDPKHHSREAFNMAYGSQDLYYASLLLDRHIEGMDRIETVALGLDYISFGFDTEHIALYIVKDYYWHAGLGPRSGNHFKTFLYTSTLWTHRAEFVPDLIKGVRPLRRYYVDAYEVPADSWRGEALLKSGFRHTSRSMSGDELRVNGRSTAEFQKAFHYNRALVVENGEYLRRIIARAVAKNAGVALFTTPYTEHYREHFPKAFRDEFYGNVQAVLKSYPTVRYYDFSDSRLFEEGDFYDANHLNYRGAAKFTRLLDAWLSAPD